MGCKATDTLLTVEVYLCVQRKDDLSRVLKWWNCLYVFTCLLYLILNSNPSSERNCFQVTLAEAASAAACLSYTTGLVVLFLVHIYCVSSISDSIFSVLFTQTLPCLDQSLAAGNWLCTFQRTVLQGYTIEVSHILFHDPGSLKPGSLSSIFLIFCWLPASIPWFAAPSSQFQL